MCYLDIYSTFRIKTLCLWWCWSLILGICFYFLFIMRFLFLIAGVFTIICVFRSDLYLKMNFYYFVFFIHILGFSRSLFIYFCLLILVKPCCLWDCNDIDHKDLYLHYYKLVYKLLQFYFVDHLKAFDIGYN